MPVQVVLPAPLSPLGSVAATTPAAHRWKRLPDRPVLGLIDNGKGRAADLLESVARQLVERGLVGSFFVVKKPSAGKPISPGEQADLLSKADLVIAGVGDCGACSSCSLHDAALCSREGTPSGVVITSPFVKLAQATALNLGASSLPVLVVDHPIWSRDKAWLDAAAQRLCAPLIAALFAAEERTA